MSAVGPFFVPRLLPLAALLAAALPAQEALASEPQASAAEVRAVFLLNFTKFVEWPPEVFVDTAAPVTLGVLGEDPVAELLEAAVAGETVGGRALTVRRFSSLDGLKPCHVLYIAPSSWRDLPAVLARLEGSRTLTVGEESERFTKKGGMIGFLLERDQVRFDINQKAAEAAGLKVSSRLLRLASGRRARAAP